MNSRAISLAKYSLGLLIGLFALATFATPAQAESYYHYQPIQWQYQQPVYYQYQYRTTQSTQELAAQLRSLLAQLETLQKRYDSLYGRGYTTNYRYDSRDYDLSVDTLYARDIEDDEATLYGEVDLDNAPYANVWFEYGEDSDLDERSDKERVNDDERFSIDIDDLDEDERYYFRAIAEAPNGDRTYGQIKSFTADDDGDYYDDYNDDEPYAETGDSDDITRYSARLEGEVDMNDFDDGLVFFVWGEDEGQVEDVEYEDSYRDVEEDGDDLLKYKVSDNLDDDRSFWLEIFSLDDETEYYYRVCVEYEDEDGDDALTCGDVEYFETD